DERSVEHLFERAAERGLDALQIVHLAPELFERLERRVLDVGDERVAEPAERLVDVAEIAMRDVRRAPQQRSARAPAVARALAARGERVGEDRPEAGAVHALVALARRALERRDGVLLHAAAQGELEEAPGAVAGAALGSDLRRTRERGEAIGR